jgi:hypothetical protein
MDKVLSQPLEQMLDIGDRIHVRPGSMPLPLLVDHMGTVVEVFRVPLGSCRVRIDGDPDHRREWFFYRDEVATSSA